MNHAKTIAGILLASTITVGCSSSGGSSAKAPATADTYKAAVASAKTSIKKAKSVGFEWRDSGKILKKADKAAKSGDFTTATKLANKARKQGELALAQAELQKNAGPQH